MTPRTASLGALLLALACGGAPKPAAKAAEAPWKDSLALTAPGGVEVWYIGARRSRDSAGVACTERVMQIRRDGTKILVPLLYTGEAPVLADDSTLRTHLWLNCRPMRLYEVNLRTGRPIPK